jgi:hypothetical protein
MAYLLDSLAFYSAVHNRVVICSGSSDLLDSLAFYSAAHNRVVICSGSSDIK